MSRNSQLAISVYLLFMIGCTAEVIRIEIDVEVECGGDCENSSIYSYYTDYSIAEASPLFLNTASCEDNVIHQISCIEAVHYYPRIQQKYQFEGYTYNVDYHTLSTGQGSPADDFCIQRDIYNGDEGINVINILGEGIQLYRINSKGEISEESDLLNKYDVFLEIDYELDEDKTVMERHRVLRSEELPVEEYKHCQCAIASEFQNFAWSHILIMLAVASIWMSRREIRRNRRIDDRTRNRTSMKEPR